MKIAIIGSRGFNDYDLLKYTMEKYDASTIISGGAKGADSLAKKYANEFSLELIEFLPDWSKYGRSAGFIRNLDIINNSDVVVAFWDGTSKGTLHSITTSQKKGKPLEIIRYDVI